jgi:succinate dehydrogenase/fumarate reductase cytochrome b subunit
MNLKQATLIAVIAVGIQTLLGFYYLLIGFGALDYDSTMQKISQTLIFLSGVGLLVFFITLYQKQPDNEN